MEGGPPTFPRRFLVSRGTPDPRLSLSVFAYRALTLFRRPSQAFRLTVPPILRVLTPDASYKAPLCISLDGRCERSEVRFSDFCFLTSLLSLHTAVRCMKRLVWPPPISLATTLGISFDFSSSAYLDVSVRRVPPGRLCVHLSVHIFSICGFPHSDIPGSRPVCGSPRLFAACHVLLRLLVPRHSPCALSCLTFIM